MSNKDDDFDSGSVYGFILGLGVGAIAAYLLQNVSNAADPWSEPWENSSKPNSKNTPIDFS